jgi:endo-1,4-beta-xylanase
MRASAFLTALLAAPALAQLHSLATRAGLKYFGTALDNGYFSDTAYMALIDNTQEVGQLVPENGQKWAYVQPTQGTFTYSNADVVPNRAAQKGQLLRCHTLTWHSQLPSWGEWFTLRSRRIARPTN